MEPLIELDAELVHETEDAYLLDFDGDPLGGEGHVWLPKSRCDFDSDNGVVRLPEWLALKKGLI